MAQVALKGNPIKLAGELPKMNAVVPDFEFVRKDLSRANLYDFTGKTRVILSFPSIDTDVCAKETQVFNKAFRDKPAVMGLTVSQDLPFALSRFCGAEGISTLEATSTFNSSFGQDYGVLITEGALKGLLARAIFVVTPDNKLRYLELVPEITFEPNYSSLLAIL